ncbi:MAG TPA: DUF1549 domain-containing protein, partial [Planctomycetaceae bacterium]|nr:DUF1549 domain-containing protein [Planctomycetaceae bacterium]
MISNRVIHAAIAAIVCVGGVGTAVGGERSPVQDAVAEIDRIVSSAITAKGLQPAPRCSDETYLRRVTLDLAGRIPTPDEYRVFRQNPDRAQLVDRLLEGEDFTRFWSEWLTTATIGSGRPFGVDREILRAWFERMLRERVPYDEVVRRILTAEGNSALDGPVNFWIRYPEQPATKVSRLFLGVRLGCARCHDHPFDRWKRIDFDRFNRFFAGVRREEISEGTIRIREELMEADGDDLPRFLTGAKPRGRLWRPQLAVYLTRSKPFARAYVNRLWYHFLGRGIVHPVDDFQRENAPAIPELLEFLR